jgi:hypothetical protein
LQSNYEYNHFERQRVHKKTPPIRGQAPSLYSALNLIVIKRRNSIVMHKNFQRLIKINEFVAQIFEHGHQWPFMPRRSFIIANFHKANIAIALRMQQMSTNYLDFPDFEIKPTQHCPPHRSGSGILTSSLVASPTNVSIHHGQAAAFSQFEFVTCMQLNHKSNITNHSLEKSLSRAVFANTSLFLRPLIQQPESHTQ